MSRQTLKSRNSEMQVCRFLASQRWTEIHHNVGCFHVQLDIVARSPEGILNIIEVKSETRAGVAHLPARQARRLLKAACVLAQAEPVEIKLAFVSERGVRLLPYDCV